MSLADRERERSVVSRLSRAGNGDTCRLAITTVLFSLHFSQKKRGSYRSVLIKGVLPSVRYVSTQHVILEMRPLDLLGGKVTSSQAVGKVPARCRSNRLQGLCTKP